MRLRRGLLSGLLLAILLIAAGGLWFSRLHTPARKIITPGKRLVSANLEVSSNTIVIIPPKPGVVFATAKKPGADDEFAFILLVKYGGRVTSFSTFLGDGGSVSQLDFLGRWAVAGAGLKLNGKLIEASCRVDLDEAKTSVKTESLAIGGEPVDISEGRVFLVDLTADPQTYRQFHVELPEIPSKLESRADAERAAKTIRKHLEVTEPEIKRALRE